MNKGQQSRYGLIIIMVMLCAYVPLRATQQPTLWTRLCEMVSSFMSPGQPPIELDAVKQDRQTLLIVDTGKHDPYSYQPFIDAATRAGFEVTYCPIDRLCDQENSMTLFAGQQVALFVFTIEFLKHMDQSVVGKRVMQALEAYARRPQVTVGLIFPAVGAPSFSKVSLFERLFDKAGCAPTLTVEQLAGRAHSAQHHQHQFLKAVDSYLSVPLEARGFGYDTSLNASRPGARLVLPATAHDRAYWAPLPFSDDAYSKSIKPVHPAFLYWFNPERNNHLLIGNSGFLSFSSVSENFQSCPFDPQLRHEMDQLVQDSLWQLHGLLYAANNAKSAVSWQSLEPLRGCQGPQVEPTSFAPQKKHKVSGLYERTAWMELEPFEDELLGEEHAQLVDYCCSFQALWVGPGPQLYYNANGRKAATKQKYLNSVSRFTQMLAARVAEKGITPPVIFVGFEIVNNLVDAFLPTNNAYDLYGLRYFDVPSPLDRTFWKQEVTDPLAQFVKDWQREEISHGIELKGVAFDLEMYGRKTTGSVLSTMGFELPVYERYSGATNSASHAKTPDYASSVSAVVEQLMSTHHMGDYYRWLENDAMTLAQELRTTCSQLIPGCVMGVYLPNISLDWFYKGFYRGMGSAESPFYLYTFNNSFYPHKTMLESMGVHAYHETVLLMSKLKSHAEGAQWMDQTKADHDGVWWNRLSRRAQPHEKAQNPAVWWAVEDCPGSDKDMQFYLRHFEGHRAQAARAQQALLAE